ncbi:MAG: 3-deoxy-D-manno-octulosonic acid transferase, partial [Gemmatimonadota bacterium]
PDFAGYPPLELRSHCDRAVEGVRPAILVFAKLDVWPGLTAAAERASVPTALLNAVVRARSGRLQPLARSLLASTYASLDRVGAASEEDAERLLALGVREETLRVTGDAAYDLAAARAERAREPGGWTERFEAGLPARPGADGLRLVAGSTWPADEEVLLDALAALPATGSGRFRWQAVFAPHSPSEAHVRRLLGSCRRRGEPAARWSELREGGTLPEHGIVVFDTMGRLAELYTVGDVAYVGGAIGGTGLHSVIEPAAAGIPVLFGPHHDRREATELLAARAAYEAAPDALVEPLALLADDETRAAAGRRAAACVNAGRGAAAASTALVEELLTR